MPISSLRRSSVLAGSVSWTVSSIALLRRLGGAVVPFDRLAPHVVGEPHRVAAELRAPVGRNPRAGAARGKAEHVYRHRHAAGMAIADLDVAIDDHRRADESHRAHADAVAERLELLLQRGDLRVRVARSDHAQAGRLLAQHHAGILRAAEPDADDRRLARKPALAEADQRVKIEPPDAVDAVARKQHAVIGAEQATLVHGGEIDPVSIRMKRVLDIARAAA